MSNDVVRVEELRKVYDLGEVQVEALCGVTLSIRRGEFVAVMGASGSGKSTFMNILGCLDRPTSGRYLLEAKDVSTMARDELASIRNTRIGFVFQGFNLLHRMSAVQNVELPMLYGDVPKTERRKRAVESLTAVGLGERQGHHPNQLSGGQQQRVAIARALVNRPAILLADEPTGNLDSRTSVEILELFQRLHRDGATIVMVTHEPDIAEYCSRQIHFRDGELVDDRLNPHVRDAAADLAAMPPAHRRA
ncbi:MAG: ABC transporter ATP-binding protein [Candidatus Wallbacteria bacterium]|nr:ABC transporter ATP-binding protein [Candidatus Wallbacteria bacterium]